MTVTLGTNIASLRGQRQLNNASSELGTIFERLSSGQRINRASDDAAGLSISQTLNNGARLNNQAVRNLNDGISLLNVADSVLASLTDITIRISELAEQSANGVYSAEQRAALNNEAQALSQEFYRLAESSEFNGMKLLDGSLSEIRLQASTSGDDNSQLVLTDFSGGATRLVGTGTFEEPIIYENNGSNAIDIGIGDVNNDGNQDFVYATGSGTLDSLYAVLGNGDGTFPTTVSEVATPVRIRDLVDFDGDGNLDILAYRYSSDTLEVRWGTGDGAFTSVTTLNIGIGSVIGDFNNDGYTDIAQSDRTNNLIRLYQNDGDRTFTELATISLTSPSSTTFTDLDKDGYLDILSVSNNTIYSSYGNGTGSFTAPQSVSTNTLFTTKTFGDINNDGHVDFIGMNTAGPVYMVALNNGDGTFRTPVWNYVDSDDGSHSGRVALHDLNGDGNLDFIAAVGTADDIFTFFGNGDGTFQEGVSTEIADGIRSFELGDLNNDGVADIALLTQSGPDVYILLAETQGGVGLPEFDLSSTSGAKNTLTMMDTARNELIASRGHIGAQLSRIQTALAVNTVTAENYLAAESRIKDADVAENTAALTRLSILQQAAASIISQANLQPQLALQLL